MIPESKGVEIDTVKKQIYSVYKVTNNVNGKIYIGYTSKDPEVRWIKHKSHMKRKSGSLPYFLQALRKYGPENFTWEVFYQTDSMDHALEVERQTIERFDSTNRAIGYNRSIGGQLVEPPSGEKNGMHGKRHTYEARKAVSVANKGRFAGENNPNYGKARPEHVLDAISKAQKGRVWEKSRCPHCLKSGATHNMKRYHFDNCRQNPQMTEAKKAELDERDRLQSERLSQGQKRFAESGKPRAKPLNIKPRVLKEVICPHCLTEGAGPNMTRYHFDKCKLKEAS